MTPSFNFSIENLKAVSGLFVSQWYFFLPLSFFILIFPNLVEPITLIGLGFIVGYGYVSPIVYGFIRTYLPNIGVILESNALVYVLAISVVFAIIFYSLYKSIIFVGSFAISFLISNFLARIFLSHYLSIGWNVYLVIGFVVGVIGGFYAVNKSAKFVGLIAVLLGSFVIVSTIFFMVDKYLFELNSTAYAWLVFVTSLFVFFFRITKLWGRGE